MSQAKSVLVIHDRPDSFSTALETRFPEIDFTYVTVLDDLPAQLATANPDIVFSIAQPHFPGRPQRLAAAHPTVRWLHIGGSGYEQFLPWPRADLLVSNSAGVLARYLAETVIGGMLALNGKFLTYLDQQRRHEWRQHSFRSLSEQTILIVGLGAIGGHVAHLAKTLGMRVLAVRRQQQPHPDVDEMHPPENLPALLGRADVVSLHVRLNDETRHMMNRQMLALLKPGALLINTARGEVVEEVALIDALRSGHIAGAYLDVFEREPLLPDSPLWDRPNVLITPHMADLVTGWDRIFANFFAENLDRWQRGEDLLNRVPVG
jgi:phosphoglycerate dehydrogenase-like enzyme